MSHLVGGGRVIKTPNPLHAISPGRFLGRPLASNHAIYLSVVVHSRSPAIER